MSHDQSPSAAPRGEPGGPGAPEQEVPAIEVRSGRSFPVIWLIPVVAGVIAIWLAYTTISGQGPVITIDFKTASGLEAGKTKVKYRDVDIGQVETVTLKPDLSGVVVTASMVAGAEGHLTETTRFWVVRPRLGSGGVSGLDTLVSGSYIEIDPGEGGEEATSFVGLETPPVIRLGIPGKEFTLTATNKGSLGPGAPINYRGVQVGQILGEELAPDGSQVTFLAFVNAPYDQWVTSETRFWDESGIEIDVGTDGVQVRTSALQSILSGGIAFETPPTSAAEPVEEGATFVLYRSQRDIQEQSISERIPYLLYFDGSVRGLTVGAPVELQGIRVGSVRDIRLEMNPERTGFRVPVTITIEPERVRVGGAAEREPYKTAEDLIRRGLRGQLRAGSLLTGQLFVALDFFPEAPAAELKYKGVYPEIPTVPKKIEQLTQSATEILDKVAGLPLDQLISDLRRTVLAVESLVDSPELKQSVKSLDSALNGVDRLVKNADRNVGPLLTNLRKASSAAEDTLVKASDLIVSADGMVGADAQLRFDLIKMVSEFSEAAKSIRVLADYLEQNPDALLRGKGALE